MSENRRIKQKKYSAKITFCRVCGDTACYINYGALTCSSCKVFFGRRGCHTENDYQCAYGNNCKITTETRRFCTRCRLAKCFAVGMASDLIRKNNIHRESYGSIIWKRNMLPIALPTLDLLSQDRSSLSSFDWTMLSNVVHAFDRFSIVNETCQIIEHLSNWPSHLTFDITPVLSLFAGFYTSAESFISSSADFQTFTLAEKQSLYQRNLHGILNLCATFVLTTSGMFHISVNEAILTSIYGHDIYQQTKRISMRLEHDQTIVKLILLILAFSTNCYMVDVHENMQNDSLSLGSFRLFGSQNRYIEILWKYMTHRYGYYEAAIRLLILVKGLLDLLKISANEHRTNEIHHHLVDEVSVLAEQSLTINDNEVVALWGKT